MSQATPSADPRVTSYMALRKAIGLTGLLLPFVLASVNMLLVSQVIVQGSVSGYYYTGVRDVLVGALCTIGAFLFAYHGYDTWDNRCTNAAGALAIGVAFFPTTPPHPSAADTVAGYVHLTCAALLFLVLAVIALWLFRKTGPDALPTPQKIRRDKVYLACGLVIVACVVLAPVQAYLLGSAVTAYQPLFWLEAAAVCAFGVAWLVKGQAILKDPEPAPAVPPRMLLRQGRR